MKILSYTLGIPAIILTFGTLCFIIKNYIRRKKQKQSDNFEIYKENELAYMMLLIFSAAFSILIIAGGSLSSENEPGLKPLIVFTFILVITHLYIAARLSKRCVRINATIITVFSKLLIPPKHYTFDDIKYVSILYNKLLIFDKNNKIIFKIHSISVNYNKFLTELDERNIKTDIQNKTQYIQIRMPLASKILSLTISFISTIGFIMLAIFNSGQTPALIIGIIFAIVSFLIFILFLLVAFRFRIIIEKFDLIYIPLFGKKRKASCKDISCVYKQSSSYRGVKKYYISIYFEKGKNIFSIPYQYEGVQEFLKLMKHKVRDEDDRKF